MMETEIAAREQLRVYLRDHSVRHGDFQLASGQRSSVYVDAKLTTCRAKAMPLVGRVFLAKMFDRGWHPDAVGGLTMGADPIAAAIARESVAEDSPIDFFVVRKEPKKHGLQKYLEGLPAPQGLRVVIVDDVCTTGASTIKAVERCREAGMAVLGAVCLVDREQGAQEALAEINCPLESIFTLEELVNTSGPAGTLSTGSLVTAGA